MAACGFYRGSGAAWQQALPPELQKIKDGDAVRQRCWEQGKARSQCQNNKK